MQHEHYTHTAPDFPSSTILSIFFFLPHFPLMQLLFFSVRPLSGFPAQSSVPQANPAFQIWSCGTLHMMLVGTVLLLCFPNAILSLFSASEEMRAFGVSAIRIMLLGFVFSGLSTMIATYEQATDKVLPSMMIQLLRQGVLLVPVMWLLNQTLHLAGIWIAFPVTELIVCIISVVFIRKDGACHES